jgi:hypothetical protein
MAYAIQGYFQVGMGYAYGNGVYGYSGGGGIQYDFSMGPGGYSSGSGDYATGQANFGPSSGHASLILNTPEGKTYARRKHG